MSRLLAINSSAEEKIYIFFADVVGNGFSKLWYLIINAKNILVLVFLYGFANLLSYYALARVEASVYTVLLQVN